MRSSRGYLVGATSFLGLLLTSGPTRASGNEVLPHLGAALGLQIVLLIYPIATAGWLRKVRPMSVATYILLALSSWALIMSGIPIASINTSPWRETLPAYYVLTVGIPLAVPLLAAALSLQFGKQRS